MPWKTAKRFRGGRRRKAQPFLEGDPKLAARTKHIRSRKLFLMKKNKLLETDLKKGEAAESNVKTSGNLGGYKEAGAPGLFPVKEAQRKDLIKDVEGGTVLELHGGRGHLTQAVYAKKMDNAVLVDSDEKALAVADKKLKGKVRHETVHANNLDWLSNEMRPEDLKNLKVVDFDPFGSPADAVKTFFDNYPIKRSMFIALTDGSKRYLGYVDGAEGRRWLKEHSGFTARNLMVVCQSYSRKEAESRRRLKRS